MKLYATIKSERAQKGQGGNEYLDIDILCGSTARPLSLARLTVRPASDLGPFKNREGYGLYDEKDTLLAYRIDETKPAREPQKAICNFNACKNPAIFFGVCKQHKKLEL